MTAPAAPVPASSSSPSWSPDGLSIAYAYTPGTVEPADRAGIWVVDANGGVPRQVLAGEYFYPDWSPDGVRLVVTGQRQAGKAGVFVLSSTGLTRISSDFGYAAKWSPKGDAIAWQTYDSDQIYRLFLASPDGAGSRCLNPSGVESWYEPSWSPDGAHIVHVRAGGWTSMPTLYVMDPEGRLERLLTSDGRPARDPSWSPDGQWIAWSSWNGNVPEIWLMRADGKEPRKIADGSWAEWAPDSRRLVYAAPRGDGGSDLRVIDLATGLARTIVH